MIAIRTMLPAVFLVATAGCLGYPTSAPPVGINTLNVPFHKQIQTYYCVPASILMWTHYRYPSINYQDIVQNDIWSLAERNGWATRYGTNPGVEPQYIPLVLQSRIDRLAYRTAYAPSDARKAVSDQLNNINSGDPVLAEANYDTHVVVVIGTSWSQVDNALLSPRVEYMVIHDPDYFLPDNYGNKRKVFMDAWMTIVGVTCSPPPSTLYGCMAHTTITPGYSALAELAEFDANGGTYYGDSNPPQVGRWKIGDGCYWDAYDIGPDQCDPTLGRWKDDGAGGCYWDPNDSGPDQCVPTSRTAANTGSLWKSARSALVNLFARRGPRAARAALARSSGSVRLNAHAPRRSVQNAPITGQTSPDARTTSVRPPFPHAQSEDEVLANILHTVRMMRVKGEPELEALAIKGNARVNRMVLVSSDLKPSVPDYYLVYLEDASKSPIAQAIISTDGVLGELVNLVGAPSFFEIPRLGNVVGRLTATFGPVNARYYFAGNNLTPSGNRFRPLVRAETSTGTIYVTVDGDIYAQEAFRPYSESISVETSDMANKYPNDKWLITSSGIVILRKTGRLE